jgi:hypothetical protein
MRHMPQEELAERGWLDPAGNRVNGPGPEWKTIEQGAATTVWGGSASMTWRSPGSCAEFRNSARY